MLTVAGNLPFNRFISNGLFLQTSSKCYFTNIRKLNFNSTSDVEDFNHWSIFWTSCKGPSFGAATFINHQSFCTCIKIVIYDFLNFPSAYFLLDFYIVFIFSWIFKSFTTFKHSRFRREIIPILSESYRKFFYILLKNRIWIFIRMSIEN